MQISPPGKFATPPGSSGRASFNQRRPSTRRVRSVPAEPRTRISRASCTASSSLRVVAPRSGIGTDNSPRSVAWSMPSALIARPPWRRSRSSMSRRAVSSSAYVTLSRPIDSSAQSELSSMSTVGSSSGRSDGKRTSRPSAPPTLRTAATMSSPAAWSGSSTRTRTRSQGSTRAAVRMFWHHPCTFAADTGR